MTTNTPILLCHAACTGGTLIFRKLCARFGLLGLSEISHCSSVAKNLFYPFDPEALMYANGWISEDDFSKIFAARLKNCESIAASTGQRLLVREHTHSLFFQPDGINLTQGFSWIAENAEELFGDHCHVICTLRDPVDSWLGIKHSFPSQADYTFDEYCLRYITFIERIKELDDSQLTLFRYEDFLDKSEEVFLQLEQKLHLQPIREQQASDILYSGNSGRQSDKLTRRSRRAYSSSFIRSLDDSRNYARLVELLGYKDCREEITAIDRIRAKANTIRKLFTSQILTLGRYGNRVVKRASVSD